MAAAAGAAAGCLWLGNWLGGMAAVALFGATTAILLGGLLLLLQLHAELRRSLAARAASEDARQRFVALVDNLPGVVFQRVQDASGRTRYSFFSKRLKDYVGVTPAEALANPARLVPRFERQAVLGWLTALSAAETTDEGHAREFKLVRPSGETRWLMVLTRPRPGGEGGRIWDGIATDISDLKQSQEELLAAKEQAILASRSKSQFLAVMSHELRTPLNAVIGFAEVLQAEFFGPLTEKQRGYTSDILQSGTHLLNIINDILDLAKIEAGKSELHEDSCDAAELIAYQIELIRPRALQAGLSLGFTAEPDLPLLYVDQTKLKQMLLNLLSNAIKFTPGGGGIEVALRLDPVEDERPLLALSIADTGVGMAPEDIPNALASFQQIDNRLARKHEGAGLGLPLVRAQIELHGGTITIDSAVDQGTTVTLRFPAWRLFRSLDELPPEIEPTA